MIEPNSKVTIGARVVLGLIFTVFGLNGFLRFLPMPELNAEAGAFMGALAAAGYMFPMVKGIEVVSGLLLLSGRFVPLALILLAPILVNIAAFHIVLQPGPGMAIVLMVLEAGIAYAYRDSFRGVLAAKPGAQDAPAKARKLEHAPSH